MRHEVPFRGDFTSRQETLDQLGACWEGLDDPRRRGHATLHDLHELLMMALCAVLCGGQGAVDIAEFAEAKEPFLRSLLTLTNGLPSHDTFSRLFRNLDPDQFHDAFQQFMAQFSEQLQGVVAIDGKVPRRSFDRASGKSALHRVSAWGSEQRLVLAQIATDAKSNEITVVPKLLRMLALKGTIVTADALNCQRTIAEQIVEQNGDYALALKGNQGTLFDDVVLLLDDPELKTSTAAPVVEADHGRIETPHGDGFHRDRLAPEAAPMAGPEGHRQSGSTARDGGQNHHRNRVLPAQPGTRAGAVQRGRPPTLGRGKQLALAIGRGDERGSGSHPHGPRAASPGSAASHGHPCHAEGGIQGILARQIQTRRLERLSIPPFGAILKCDCPGLGRRTGMQDGTGAAAWSYDPMGRVTATCKTLNGVTEQANFTYNLDGTVNTLQDFGGTTLTYSYTPAGLQSGVSSSSGSNYAASGTYDSVGQLTGLAHQISSGSADIQRILGYNNRLQPSTIQATANGTYIQNLTLEHPA